MKNRIAAWVASLTLALAALFAVAVAAPQSAAAEDIWTQCEVRSGSGMQCGAAACTNPGTQICCMWNEDCIAQQW